MKTLQEYIIESLLDDFDTMSDFQDLSIILDNPNFDKTSFNKLKRLFKKAGGGEDYNKERDDNNKDTYFIAYDMVGLNHTCDIVVGIPDKVPTMTRLYFPGRRPPVEPDIWTINPRRPAASRFNRTWSKILGPISIPDKYVPYFERLMQTAPEIYSKEHSELNDKKRQL